MINFTPPYLKTFFISDTHFSHKIAITKIKRPYKTIEAMDKDLILRWNKEVPKDGVVFHLGDVSFASPERTVEILKSLNGKIYIIPGNHDYKLDQLAKKGKLPTNTTLLTQYEEVSINYRKKNYEIMMCHYPIIQWNKKHYGSMHVYGHCHGSMTAFFSKMKAVDVGVDVRGFKPVAFLDLLKIMDGRDE